MKFVAPVLLAISLISCREDGSAEAGYSPPSFQEIPWIEGSNPLSEYEAKHPDLTILAFFTMDWDTTGRVLEKFLNEMEESVIPRDNILFVKFDCTERESIGWKELINLETPYLPMFASNQSGEWKRTPPPNDFKDFKTGFLSEIQHLLNEPSP